MKSPAFLALALAMATAAFSQTTPPAAPALTAGAEFKGLRFDWDTVPGATRYQLEYRAHQTGDFLELGLPEANRTADRRLADWLASRPPFKPAETAADWATVVRDAVRSELAKASQS